MIEACCRPIRLLFVLSVVAAASGDASANALEMTADAAPALAQAGTSATTPSTQNNDAADIAFWQSVKDTSDAAELEAYIKAFPTGRFVELARVRLGKLKKPDAGQKAETPPGGTPTAPAPSSAAPVDFSDLDKFGDILERVRSDYVDKPNDVQLFLSAIDGVVAHIPMLADDGETAAVRRKLNGLNGKPNSLYSLLDLFGEFLEYAISKDPSHRPRREIVEAATASMLDKLDTRFQGGVERPRRPVQADSSAKGGSIGVELKKVDGANVVVNPLEGAPAAGKLRPGDRIQKVDGEEVASRDLESLVGQLRGPVGSSVKLSILREGKIVDVSLVRDVVRLKTIESRAEKDIGYVRLVKFGEKTEAELTAAIAKLRADMGPKMTGLVLDIRSNVGGLMDQIVAVADDFLDHGIITTAKSRSEEKVTQAKPGQIASDLRLAVLVDEGTQSGGEILGAALQDNGRAQIVGTATPGSGGIETVIPLGDGTQFRLLTARIIRPSGLQLEGNGLKPNVAMSADLKDPTSDPQLQAALNLLRAKDK